MAVISRKLGYLFICAPGTGSSSASKFLIESYEGEWIPAEDVVYGEKQKTVSYKHSTIPQLLEIGALTQEELDGLFKFVAVRNPYQFWVSDWYRYRRWEALLADPNSWISRNPKLVKRVEMAKTTPLREYIAALLQPMESRPRQLNAQHMKGVDRVIKQETLEEDINAIMKELGCFNGAEMPHVNVTTSADKHYANHLDEETRDLIYRVFRPTFQKFSYE